jgi:DNA-binding Lrp family transcriptional regulator
MVTIDAKDRKLLYHLDLNCRQSNTQIGKKVGLKKDVVAYRIKKMEDEGIITGYWTNIDSYRFGYDVYRYYLVLQNAASEIKEEIVKYIATYGDTWVVGAVKSIYDISAVFWVNNTSKFYQFWDNLNERYGDYISDKLFSVYLQADVYPLSFLLKEEYPQADRETYMEENGSGEVISIDEMDYRLLEAIADDARMPLVDLAERIGCSSQTARYRIDSLMKKGVIQGFHIGLNHEKLGLKHFKIDIWLKEVSKRKKLWEFFRKIPHVTFINTSAGYADIEIECIVNSSDDIIQFMDKIYAHHPNAIRKYIYWSTYKLHMIQCLPKLSFTK